MRDPQVQKFIREITPLYTEGAIREFRERFTDSSIGGRFSKQPIRGQDFKFQPIREPYLAHVTRFDREVNFW